MIPYDDLVIALATWRARQGLPVSRLSGVLTPPPSAVQGRGPASAPPSPPPRAASPAPQPRSTPARGMAVPPPLETPIEESLEGDVIEEASVYDSAAVAIAMGFGDELAPDPEPTSVAAAPRPSVGTPIDAFGSTTDAGQHPPSRPTVPMGTLDLDTTDEALPDSDDDRKRRGW